MFSINAQHTNCRFGLDALNLICYMKLEFLRETTVTPEIDTPRREKERKRKNGANLKFRRNCNAAQLNALQ